MRFNEPPRSGKVTRIVTREDQWYAFVREEDKETEPQLAHQRQRKSVRPTPDYETLEWISATHLPPPKEGDKVYFCVDIVGGREKVIAWTLADEYEQAVSQIRTI